MKSNKSKDLISGTVGGKFVVSDQAFASIVEIEIANKRSKYKGQASKSYAASKISRPSVAKIKNAFSVEESK